MVVSSPGDVRAGGSRPHTPPPPPPHDALQRAEDGLLQSIDQLPFGAHGAAKPPSDSHDPRVLWWRGLAMAVAGAAAGVARYPVVTATLRAQLTGRTEAIAWTWRTAPVGVWYQWPGGHNLLVVQYVVHVALPEPKTTVGIVGNLAFHYLAYGVLYGLTRQAVVARLLTTPPGVADLLRPVRQWVWDRVLLRGPRGAVFCACLRDVGWYFAQGLLGPCFTRLLAEARYRARLLGAGDSPHKRPRRALREPRLYDQAVGTFLTRIVVRAVLYPVDATIVRLMADEAGLTAHGYTGFFDCLRRSSAPLYSGFTRALVADLALGWAAAEAAHALSMLVWRLY